MLAALINGCLWVVEFLYNSNKDKKDVEYQIDVGFWQNVAKAVSDFSCKYANEY